MRPNILVLMCDQLQAAAVCDAARCATPNFDALRSRGITFTRAYTANPVCSPARASLMTGKLPHNHGVLWVTHTMPAAQVQIRSDLPHFAQDLVQAGYRTSYVGKWHVEPDERPDRYGWQFDGSLHSATYTDYAASRAKATHTDTSHAAATGDRPAGDRPAGDRPAVDRPAGDRPTGAAGRVHGDEFLRRLEVAGDGYRSDLLAGVTTRPPEERPMGTIVSLALDELARLASVPDVSSAAAGQPAATDPWCLFVSTPEPHDPFVCGTAAYAAAGEWDIQPEANWADDGRGRPRLYQKAAAAFAGLSAEERLFAARCYYASVAELDAQFGRLLEALDQRDLRENTVVVLVTDHGEFLGAHGMYCKNIGAWEEAYNVPLVIAGPTVAHGALSAARVGTHALFPSLLRHYGIPTQLACDAPLFDSLLATGRPADGATHDLRSGYAEYHGGRLLLTQRIAYLDNWKLVWNGFDDHELYDLAADPGETINLVPAATVAGPGGEAATAVADGAATPTVAPAPPAGAATATAAANAAANHPAARAYRELTALVWAEARRTGDHTLVNSHYLGLRAAPIGPGTPGH